MAKRGNKVGKTKWGKGDSNTLDDDLATQGIDLTPHKPHRINPVQDSRKLQSYKKRWKIEQFFAHLSNFRKLVVPNEHYAQNRLAFVHLAAVILLLRHF